MDDYRFFEVLYQSVTPLHVGCGSDAGVVDLPVERERATGFPFLPGSGIRGSLRARMGAEDGGPARLPRLFGPESGDLAAGCVSVLDARLLLFPVRSAPGIFHWVTCPFALQRYRADCEAFLGSAPSAPALPPSAPAEDRFLGGDPAAGTLYLEEFRFERQPLPQAGAPSWAWSLAIEGVDSRRVVLVDDAAFRHFTEQATVVATRNRLTAEKTVAEGQLFSIEAVPPETVFYGFLGAVPERAAGKAWHREEVASELHAGWARRKASDGKVLPSRRHLHLGGEESVGWGVTRLSWLAPPQPAPGPDVAGEG